MLPENHPITRHVRRVVTRILEASNLGTLASPEPKSIAVSGPTEDLWSPETSFGSEPPPGAGGREWNLMVVNDDRIVNAAASYGQSYYSSLGPENVYNDVRVRQHHSVHWNSAGSEGRAGLSRSLRARYACTQHSGMTLI